MTTSNPFAKGAANNIFTSGHTPQAVSLTPVPIGTVNTNLFKPNIMGTVMVTNTAPNIQPIGSYRAEKYVPDKLPLNPIKSSWTSMSVPFSINAER